tara:strand:+ start:161 stop:1057 length:897 start_codon:yes stop_codon:yes gene_type:complete
MKMKMKKNNLLMNGKPITIAKALRIAGAELTPKQRADLSTILYGLRLDDACYGSFDLYDIAPDEKLNSYSVYEDSMKARKAAEEKGQALKYRFEKSNMWKPLEERIATCRYLMEAGPDLGVVEILVTEIIDAFRSGETLKTRCKILPPYNNEEVPTDDDDWMWGCSQGLLAEANNLITENQPKNEMSTERKQLLENIRENELEIRLPGFQCDVCISGCHETQLLIKPEGSNAWAVIKHLGKDSILAAEGDLKMLMMQAEGELAVAKSENNQWAASHRWETTISRLQDMLDAAMYKDQE